MASTDIPGAVARINARDKDVPWYNPSMSAKLGKPARELFEKYSKIPADEIESHIHAIRDEAWQIWPYPCIGQFRFLDLGFSLSPAYPEALEILKSDFNPPPKFLDLGCCFGQDTRKLVYDGVPSERTYGSDLRGEYFGLGYKLFRDESTLKTRFIAADIFDTSSELFQVLGGEVDVIYAGSFLHLFNYAEQVEVCKAIVKLFKDKKGSMVVGRQVGSKNVGEKVHRTNKGQSMFRHNGESFKKMWAEVGDATGTMWRAEVDEMLIEVGDDIKPWDGDNEQTRLGFVVYKE